MTPEQTGAELAAIHAELAHILTECDNLTGVRTPETLFRAAERAAYRSAAKVRAWKARAINLNPEPLHNAVALGGMVPMQIEGGWMLAVAIPQPRYADDPIDDVVVIDTKRSTARVLGDHTAAVVAPKRPATKLAVHTDPKAWARDIALARLEWFRTRQMRRNLLQATPSWSGDIPSALLLDKPARVHWADLDAEILDVPAHLRADVRKAVFAQARLPRVEGRA